MAVYKTGKGPRSIAITFDTSNFALGTMAASENDVQIIIHLSILDPKYKTHLACITSFDHGMGDYILYDPRSIMVTIGTSTHSGHMVTNNLGGVQIINITDPYNPTSASAI